MAKIIFTVPGRPEALKRHRSVLTAAGVRQYDPSAADKKDFLAMAMSCKPDKPFEGPLRVRTEFYFDRPKSHYNSKGLKPTAPEYKVSRPDKDNLEKFVYDALNGIFYKDDAQIVHTLSLKRYAEQPCVYVEIEEIQ
jgi:Holliday junction resolvase RusA-like endonuclease